MSKVRYGPFDQPLIRLPKQLLPARISWEDIQRNWGFVITDNDDDERTHLVKVPAGWKLEPTTYFDRYSLVDPLGRKRADVSIEALPPDTGNPLTDEAISSFRKNSRSSQIGTRMIVHSRFCVFHERRSAEKMYGATYALDRIKNKPVFIAGYCTTKKYSDLQVLELAVQDWLLDHYPDNLNPFAYWDRT